MEGRPTHRLLGLSVHWPRPRHGVAGPVVQPRHRPEPDRRATGVL